MVSSVLTQNQNVISNQYSQWLKWRGWGGRSYPSYLVLNLEILFMSNTQMSGGRLNFEH